MPIFKKKKEDLPEVEEYGFPELEKLEQNIDKIKAELAAKEASNPGLGLPEAPRAPGMPEELPELPDLPDEEELKPKPLPKKPEKLKPKPTVKAEPEKKAKKQLFIKVDRFKEILASTKVIGEKIEQVEAIMQKLKDIREKEGETIEQWNKEIQELKSKLETIESTLEEVQ